MSILRGNVEINMVEVILIKGFRCLDEVFIGFCWLLRNMIFFSREELFVVGFKMIFWAVCIMKEGEGVIEN